MGRRSARDDCVAQVRAKVEARIAEKLATQTAKSWSFVGVLHAMHERVTKHAASWYTRSFFART